MAPLLCQISNRGFFDFLRTYYCNFLNNVYRYGRVFSSGNAQLVTGPAGIAVSQNRHYFFSSLKF